MDSKQILLMSALIILLSIGSFWLSNVVMQGYQDCRLDEPFFRHTPNTPLPNNCASGVRLLLQVVLGYFGFGILLLLLIPFFINWQQEQSTENETIK
jgi:hypothetical protein